MIDVLMPCAPDRIIPEPVISSILMQDEEINIFIGTHIATGPSDARIYLHSEWIKRQSDSQFVFMMDNDLVLQKGSLTKLRNFLEQNSDFGAIAISKSFTVKEPFDEAKHIDSAPLLFRSAIFREIRYRNDPYCECQHITQDLREENHRIAFLGGLKCQHIIETRISEVY